MQAATARRSRRASTNLPAIPEGRVRVTADLATDLLKRNRKNRPVSRREVDRLKRILEAGKFRYNGEAVKFDKKGNLKDGQHRLTAVAESGVPADMLIVTGLDENVFTTLDQGRKRTGGDVLFMRGIKRYNAVSVACATIYRVFKNRAIYGAVDPIPAYGIDEVIDRHPGLAASVEYCAPLHSAGDSGVIGLGYLAAFHYLIENTFNDPDKAASFVEGITKGTGLEDESPILQFRRRVLSAGRRRDIMHAQAKTALIAKVVGLHLSGQNVKYLTQPPTSATYESLIPGLAERIEQMTEKAALADLSY